MLALAAVALLGVLGACSGTNSGGSGHVGMGPGGLAPSSGGPPGTASAGSATPDAARSSSPPAPSFTPAPARTVAPLPPGKKPAVGEVARRCPYIASSPEQNPRTNVADIVGSHVLRTTVLTRSHPQGCRFYFYAPPYEAIADIQPRTFGTPSEAYNAMVRTGTAGGEVRGVRDLVPGVDAVLYRTRFFGPDGAQDWACAFAAGRTLVVVHTQSSETSLNARNLAQAIAPRF